MLPCRFWKDDHRRRSPAQACHDGAEKARQPGYLLAIYFQRFQASRTTRRLRDDEDEDEDDEVPQLYCTRRRQTNATQAGGKGSAKRQDAVKPLTKTAPSRQPSRRPSGRQASER